MMMLCSVVLVLALVQLSAAFRVAGVARFSSRGFAPLKMADGGAKVNEPKEEPPTTEKQQAALDQIKAKMAADPNFDPTKGKLSKKNIPSF
jgi:hypothetical protein